MALTDLPTLPHAKNITMHQPYNNLRERFGSSLTAQAFDLLNKMLTYDPKKVRMSGTRFFLGSALPVS